tara:strand:- start:104 stop:478 length:375 start_codon:yes stop_codon:yes gene_type:complete
MNLTERAIKDTKQITSNGNDWGVSAVFVAPTAETATVNVIHVKHNTGFDLDGMRVNSKIASIAVSEGVLIDAAYPTRDSSDEATLKNHRVSISDSTNNVKEYLVSENYPDEKLGLIVLILVDFE